MRAEDVDMTREDFAATFGQRNDAVLRALLGQDLPDDEVVRLSSAKEGLYRDLVATHGIEPLPGVRRWLDALRAAGWRQAIASSAPYANLEAIFTALGVRDYFAAVVSGDDIEHGKPDPGIFLEAAHRLGVEPGRCVVVEDAHVGIAGARRAGMHTVGVLFSHDTLDADIVVPTLEHLAPDAFDRLVPQWE